MIFKLHYWLLTSGVCAIGILMGVFIETYTDASSFEIGALYMLMPFMGIISRPIICSMADRRQAHQKYIMICLFVTAISYLPFVVIPFLGPAVYLAHGRLCWYSLVFLKIIGDIAFGGVVSIGDSLAINYASRIGTDFNVYRVWGTLSWMTFGMIIGQINEVSFLPKYVPAFLILITSSLLDMALIWLWPPEYFVMVAREHNKRQVDTADDDKQQAAATEKPKGKLDAMKKSLMPKEVVWAHIKGKLLSLICCSSKQTRAQQQLANSSNQVNVNANHQLNINLPAADCNQQQQQTLAAAIGEKPSQGANIKKVEQQQQQQQEEIPIGKKVQIRILFMLFKKDLRICLYLAYFVVAGMSVVSVSFFFMNLSKICHEQSTCQFSELGGMIQASMAICETILLIYVKQIKATIGRVNTCVLSLALVSVKYLFYGTIWVQVSPYYSIILECLHGVIFGIFLTTMVEMGHEFANEVEFLIPDLMEEGIVTEEAEAARLKLSLAATMQALISSANDGIGRGVGALIYGFVLESYTYETLWLIIGISASVCCLIAISISIVDRIFDFQLGLDKVDKQLRSPQLDLEDLSRKESFSSHKANSLTNNAA